jgi:hypothetical protein
VVAIARDTSKPLIAVPNADCTSSMPLLITPDHPILISATPSTPINGENSLWVRPRDVEGSRKVYDSSGVVFNFILDHEHVLMVNGVACVTWGHGIEGPVVGHDYFGSMSAVRSDLSRLRGWSEGFVNVTGCMKESPAIGSAVVVSLCGEVATTRLISL